MNILQSFSNDQKRSIRKLVLALILATDMDQHGKIMAAITKMTNTSQELHALQCPKFAHRLICSTNRNLNSESDYDPYMDSNCLKISQEENETTSSEDTLLLLQMIIKCADLSNVMKPFFLAKRWTSLLLLEWFKQGDKERQLGLQISKYMNRDDSSALM